METAQIDSDAESHYTIRRYQSGDEAAVTALREEVWGQTFDESWFTWKYVDNPYLDHIPVIVAESDGSVVGTRPFVGFRIAANSDTVTALLATDTMVHPDYRRQGLFTRMTERALDRYADGNPALVFNFPNPTSLTGYRSMGWRVVEPCRTFYRIANPAAIASGRDGAALERFVGLAATPLASAYLAVRDGLGTAGGELSVDRHDGLPEADLTRLYERNRPDAIHVRRDEAFYRWRFSDPVWDRSTTYLAHDGGEPIAGVVVQDRTSDEGVHKTAIADVVPMTGGDRWEATIDRLLGAVVADRPTSDVFVATDGTIPTSVLASSGFLGDHVLPLSAVSDPPYRHVVRPLGSTSDWQLGAYRLTDPDDWALGLCERPYY